MNYNTVYVGMDVHKESFSLCAYTIEAEKASHYQRTEADYKKVLNYLEFLRTIYGDDANFICGYEAGCFGYTLYHQLTANNVKCIILAPTTMLEQRSNENRVLCYINLKNVLILLEDMMNTTEENR